MVDGDRYRQWLEEIDALSSAQRAEVRSLLARRSSEAEVFAALERRVLAEHCCAHRHHQGVVCRGRANGLRRFYCAACGKTFNALTGTPLAHLHHEERWFDLAQSLGAREVVRESAVPCAIAISTAFRWRAIAPPRAIKTDAARLGGIVEADETYVLEGRKGSRAWKRAAQKQPGAAAPDRKPRKRGGKASKRGLSHEQVPVLLVADRSGATVSAILETVSAGAIAAVLAPALDKDALLVTDGAAAFAPCARQLGVTHGALNQSTSERVRGALHTQTVNSRHERFKDLLRRHRGIATQHLASHLKWFHLAGIHADPSPRACLDARLDIVQGLANRA